MECHPLPNSWSIPLTLGLLESYIHIDCRYVTSFTHLLALSDIWCLSPFFAVPTCPNLICGFWTKQVETGCVGKRIEAITEVCDRLYRFVGSF